MYAYILYIHIFLHINIIVVKMGFKITEPCLTERICYFKSHFYIIVVKMGFKITDSFCKARLVWPWPVCISIQFSLILNHHWHRLVLLLDIYSFKPLYFLFLPEKKNGKCE